MPPTVFHPVIPTPNLLRGRNLIHLIPEFLGFKTQGISTVLWTCEMTAPPIAYFQRPVANGWWLGLLSLRKRGNGAPPF
jgi:hypothetical protein